MRNKFTVSLAASLCAVMLTGSFSLKMPEQLMMFFPSAAISINDAKDDEELKVVKTDGDVTYSFRLAEIIKGIIDKLS